MGLECFHFPRFSSLVSLIGLEGFSPATWSLETHQLPYGAKVFSFSLVFLFSLPHRVRRFFTQFPSTDNFHVQRSSRLKRKAIVMLWSWGLPITWSRHVTTHMICSYDPNTWLINFILTLSHHWYHHPCHHSHVMTTSEPLICHTTTISPYHHGTQHPSSKDLVWALRRVLWRPIKKTTSRSTPVLESGGGSLIEGKCPQLL